MEQMGFMKCSEELWWLAETLKRDGLSSLSDSTENDEIILDTLSMDSFNAFLHRHDGPNAD
jgi:hypothetical protein